MSMCRSAGFLFCRHRCRRHYSRRSRWFRGWRWHGSRYQAIIAQEVYRPEFRCDIEQSFLLSGTADHARCRHTILIVRNQFRCIRHFHLRVIAPQSHVHPCTWLQVDQHAVTDAGKSEHV